MYLSRLIISNYKSIKFLDLEFSPTKNVIIGHNNAGKSNIIKALNIILGEQTPDYKKYENITEIDFFKGENKKLFIIGEISKKENSSIKISDLELSRKGSFITKNNDLKDFYEYDNFNDFVSKVMNTNFDFLDKKEKRYLKNDKDKEFLNSISKFIYVFMAKIDENNKIEKNLKLVFVQNNDWYISQYPFLRNEILISAIIPPFRDPDSQLRLTNYTWFGKLIRELMNQKKTRNF